MASLLLAIALAASPKTAPAVTPNAAAAVTPLSGNGSTPLVGVAPALTATALRDELRARSQQRQEELAGLARQKEELQRLAAEVAAARLALEATQHPPQDPRNTKATDARGDGAKEPKPALASPATSPEALARTVKGMKPDQAAVLIQRLDRGLAVEVIRWMKPADTAAILEKLKPDIAADLFSAMAARSVPAAQGQR